MERNIMKLLICTQIVDSNDSNLGFFHEWIAEFAKQCEEVTVICLKKGTYALPPNVRVLSLGKEEGTSKLIRIIRFYKYIFAYKNDYDAVFVHMNPEYVLMGSFLWKRWRKPIALWYAHKSVTWKLRKAVERVDRVFSVSDTSFKVPTPKLTALGHGIDTELFKPQIREDSTRLRLITTGRIAESKHLIEMLEMLDVLHERKEKSEFTIVGEPTTQKEKEYAKQLQAEILSRPYSTEVHLLGAIAHKDLPALLNTQDMFLNFGTTGNMDKAGLEALACGVPLLATNEAFAPLLSPYELYVESGRSEDAADALQNFMNRPDQSACVATLRNKVVEQHSLAKLIPRILMLLES
jgi:glycosyltransferase involved in cell wall biosynthesis